MEEMRIYVANRNKYIGEDGEYPAQWFTCPVNEQEIREALQLDDSDEIEIEDCELPFRINANTPLWEINANCKVIEGIADTPLYYELYEIMGRWFQSFDDFTDNKDKIKLYPYFDSESFADYLVESGELQMDEKAKKYINYKTLGMELERNENYYFSAHGVFYYPD